MSRVRVLNDTVGNTEILVLSDPISAAMRFFRRHLAGQPALVFELRSHLLVDSGTETIWTLMRLTHLRVGSRIKVATRGGAVR